MTEKVLDRAACQLHVLVQPLGQLVCGHVRPRPGPVRQPFGKEGDPFEAPVEELPGLALSGLVAATWMMAIIDGDDGPDLDGLVVEQALPAPAAGTP